MSTGRVEILTSEQIAGYEECGFVQSIPVLSPEEVHYFRDQIEKTWVALGGPVTRADGLHLFFRWAWELATHLRLLDCMEELLGPNIVLKHSRLFYKYGKSAAWVGWHQDGYTEGLTKGQVPAIWLGLTEATVENGCLRVIPRSHRIGMMPHFLRWDQGNLASSSKSIHDRIPLPDDDNELSVKVARVPEGLDPPHDVVMRAGEMSFHHPLVFHGSNANSSAEPRIGLSATYSTPELHKSGDPVALVRGSVGPHHSFELSPKPANLALEDAAAAYRVSGHQILKARD
jgi:non-haem Fe2+, alpha-ketoglutarate-dependent halogenase